MAKYGDKNRYNLTGLERETILSYNDRDELGTIYTCNAAMIRRLERLCTEFPNVYKLKCEDEASKTYYVSKKLIGIKKPARSLTDEEKQRLSERGTQQLASLRQKQRKQAEISE
jgi:hypothetical protein